jgi:hypothetical protein
MALSLSSSIAVDSRRVDATNWCCLKTVVYQWESRKRTHHPSSGSGSCALIITNARLQRRALNFDDKRPAAYCASAESRC